jgi:uncharacterized protein (TIGR03435 family)
MRTGTFFLAFMAIGMVFGQAPPTFEVASIKPSGANSVRGSNGGPGSSDPNRYVFNMATLQDLIAVAYNVDYFQISGKTALDKERFDLAVKLPLGAAREQFRGMMQALLADRFHLKVRLDTRDFPAYQLSVAKSGAKLKESKIDAVAAEETPRPAAAKDGFPELPPNQPAMSSNHSVSGGAILIRMRAQQQPISALARFLRSSLDMPVVDKTGLTAKYDFTLEFSRDLPNTAAAAEAPTPAAPSLSAALQQQLGLQVVEKKVPFPVVVIESVDKVPTEN